jgi:hypothetical protein
MVPLMVIDMQKSVNNAIECHVKIERQKKTHLCMIKYEVWFFYWAKPFFLKNKCT